MKLLAAMIRKGRSAIGILHRIQNWPLALADHTGLLRTAYMCRLRNGLRFSVRAGTDDSRILFEIFVRGCYRRAVVTPGANVIDIGANIGGFSVLASRTAARVIACEPHPDNLTRLRQNVALNGASNIEIIPAAVSHTSGTAWLRPPHDASFVGRYSLHAGDASRAIEVPTITLDALAVKTRLTRIDLVKVDCQGAEYEILYGASDTLLLRIRQLIVECERFQNHPRWSRAALDTFLRAHGFDVSSEGSILYAWKLDAESLRN